ncbi:hypothetical protein FRC07_004147, partial [Ceratobasidium sp. 392]
MSRIPTFTLNDKRAIPAIAFGTATGHSGFDDTNCILRAIQGGFNHIDTAQAYRNEESVGEALRQALKRPVVEKEEVDVEAQNTGGLAREDIWVTTNLKKLGIPSVDLYLIHSPRVAPDILKTWSELESAHEYGKAKSIGVSNFNIDQIKLILEHGNIPPAVNQIEFHPYNYEVNKELLEFCRKHGVQVESYGGLWPISAFPKGKLDDVIATIAKRLGPKVTPAQVLLSWVYAKGVVVVT